VRSPQYSSMDELTADVLVVDMALTWLLPSGAARRGKTIIVSEFWLGKYYHGRSAPDTK